MSYLWYWPSGGWDFDAWRSRHSWQPVTSPQSGQTDLLPLLKRSATADEWTTAREEWLRLTCDLLGTVTDSPPAVMRWELLESREAKAHTLRRICYTLTDAEWGYAWLLTPRNLTAKRPAIIALHQTVPQGKDEPVGLDGDPQLAYGMELAERGFVVLAPDAIAFGERLGSLPTAYYHSAEAFFAAHPDGSVMAKMVFDVQRATDLLQLLPEVDGDRIGCIGHSHGAYGTLFAMLFEPRIQAGVISCGFTTLRADPTPERWWRNTALLPRLGFYEGQIAQAPLDFHHLLALIAPRPLMVVAGQRDAIFPNTDNMPQVLAYARQVYRLCGAPSDLHRWIFDGPHRFPTTARTHAFKLLALSFSCNL